MANSRPPLANSRLHISPLSQLQSKHRSFYYQDNPPPPQSDLEKVISGLHPELLSKPDLM